MDMKSWSWKRRTSAFPELSNLESVRHEEEKIKEEIVLVDSLKPQQQQQQQQQHQQQPQPQQQQPQQLQHQLQMQHAQQQQQPVQEGLSEKEQLQSLSKERSVLLGRLSQLDGALKDSARQVRLVREEQEQKRQELLQKKAKDMEKLRVDYEAQLADVGRHLLEAGAENKVMTMTLQEHFRRIGELNSVKSQLETDIKLLHLHIEGVEKDKATLKYEVHMLKKELQAGNEERNFRRRDMEAANKQHIENVKRISKLEGDCQKLRSMLRRKLPGPNALAQMKVEADGDRRSSRGSYGSADIHKLHKNGSFEADLLLERVLSMEEETKMLKEALAQRNEEVEAAKVACTKAASKMAAMEAYFDRTLGRPKRDHIEAGEDGMNCSGKWASALIAELSQFEKGKPAEASVLSPALSIMDDFADMERLASTVVSEKSKEETMAAEVQKEPETVISLLSRGVELVEAVFVMAKEFSLITEEQSSARLSRIKLLNLDNSTSGFCKLVQELRDALSLIVPAAEKDAQHSENEKREDVNGKTTVEAGSKMEHAEEELNILRNEKGKLQDRMEATARELNEARQVIDELKIRLLSNDHREDALVVDEVEAQARSTCDLMRDVVSTLEEELEEEYKNHEATAELADAREAAADAQEASSSKPKEQELADAGAKLAECQRTISALEKQLNALSACKLQQQQQQQTGSLSLSSEPDESRTDCDEARTDEDESKSEQPQQQQHSRMFEELGLSSPLQLSSSRSSVSAVSAAGGGNKNLDKHRRPSFSRFFGRKSSM